uniref:Orf53b n=1 Tax=Moineauvirus Sfi21 TaxID=64186 RepID=O21863_9CAUD|nr:orf53b [Streptococcus phage Sfi21]
MSTSMTKNVSVLSAMLASGLSRHTLRMSFSVIGGLSAKEIRGVLPFFEIGITE